MSVIDDAFREVTKKLNDMQRRSIFCDIPENEYEKFPDRVDRHNMTNRHTEILGQFLDRHPVDEETLKDVLIEGFISVSYKNIHG